MLWSYGSSHLIGWAKTGRKRKRKRMSNTRITSLSWLLSNNRLEKVPFVTVPHTSSNWLLLSNQDKGCTPSVAHSLPLPLGPALLNLWNVVGVRKHSCLQRFMCGITKEFKRGSQVISLWSSGHFDGHIWRWFIVSQDLARLFGMICAHFCYCVFYCRIIQSM